jgi:acyl carrier protein
MSRWSVLQYRAWDKGEVLEQIFQLVRRCAKSVNHEEHFAADRELTQLGVDSMALVELLAGIEESFNIIVPDEMLTMETFESARSVTAAVMLLLTGRPG